MKKILMIAGASMIFLPACPVFAEVAFTGEVGMSLMFTNVDGNATKFNEYRDTNQDRAYGNVRLKYDTDEYFLEAKASDIGYDTQRYGLEGGVYGNFKAYLNYSEIPHNYTLGATTFYSDIGSNHLTAPNPVPLTSAWTPFDYAIKRQAVEVGFSVDRWKPFFFEFSSPNERKTGTYPLGMSLGGRPLPSYTVEVPQPIDYTTNTLNFMAGYVKNPYFGAVSVFYSQFNNDNQTFIVDSPGAITQNSYSLPPDNEAYKVAFKGSIKQLPFNSQFSTNLGTGRMTSDQSVLTGGGTPVYGPVFNGKVDTNNIDLVLISNPVHFLHSKIYYNYNQRRNESDQLALTETNVLYGYEKNKAGVDLGWTLPAKFKLDTGYSYLSMDRQGREDIPKTVDNTLSAELRYRGFEFMTPKISYQWLQRSGDHEFFDPAGDDAAEAYIWRYDVAPKIQNTLKASVDIFPTANLNFNVGYKLIDINYNDTVLGLKSSRSNQVNLDVGYTLGKFAKLTAYYDLELKKTYQFERLDALDPTTNWDLTLKDNSYSWGAGSEIYLMPKTLSLLLQYDNVNSNGDADFGLYYAGADPNPDMANWDDYRLNSYSIKLRYSIVSQYTFTLGYAYQSYKYNSGQWDNYSLVNSSNTLLSSAYANPNYDAQILFVGVEYKF